MTANRMPTTVQCFSDPFTIFNGRKTIARFRLDIRIAPDKPAPGNAKATGATLAFRIHYTETQPAKLPSYVLSGLAPDNSCEAKLSLCAPYLDFAFEVTAVVSTDDEGRYTITLRLRSDQLRFSHEEVVATPRTPQMVRLLEAAA